MNTSGWFDDTPVLGKLPPDQAVAKLRELGEDEAAESLEIAHAGIPRAFGKSAFWHSQDKPWQHTAHAFGYIAPAAPSNDPLPIRHAGNIAADPSLKNSSIKITLDRMRVAAYPGGGVHRVLFDFYAQNQVPGNVEHLHFSTTFRANEGEQAGVIGYPIFVGLNVGTEGVALKCFTVNVKNDQDEAFLGFLESDVFRAGLKLASTMQPAIAPFSQMALGLTKSIAGRNRNVAVQDFYMGLDFSRIPTGARLAEGSYLAVQIPEKMQAVWNWEEWVFNPANGQIVNKTEKTQLIPYNYIVFSVNRYDGA
jgi:hypothetical protein